MKTSAGADFQSVPGYILEFVFWNLELELPLAQICNRCLALNYLSTSQYAVPPGLFMIREQNAINMPSRWGFPLEFVFWDLVLGNWYLKIEICNIVGADLQSVPCTNLNFLN